MTSFISNAFSYPPPPISHQISLPPSLHPSLPNLSIQEQRVESAAYVWELIQNCLEILEISDEEAHGLWSLLAAIYHLGNANVKKSKPHTVHMCANCS